MTEAVDTLTTPPDWVGVADALTEIDDVCDLLAALSSSEISIEPGALNLVCNALRTAHDAAAASLGPQAETKPDSPRLG